MSEDLPFSSRGGTSVRHHFPYTGEYVLKVRFAGMARPPETVDIRIDGTRVAALETPGRSNFEDPVDEGAVEARVSVDAGPHVVGVSFRKATLMNETRYPQYFPWGNSANVRHQHRFVVPRSTFIRSTSADRSIRKTQARRRAARGSSPANLPRRAEPRKKDARARFSGPLRGARIAVR